MCNDANHSTKYTMSDGHSGAGRAAELMHGRDGASHEIPRTLFSTCVLCGHFLQMGDEIVGYGELQQAHERCAESGRAICNDACCVHNNGTDEPYAFRSASGQVRVQPVVMVLFCFECHGQHVDRGEWATADKAHKTHLCEYCGALFQPANIPTVGVDSLKSAREG